MFFLVFIKEVGSVLGYDTSVSTNLWKDRVNTELNFAVLYSFNKSGVAIVDHHTLVSTFDQRTLDQKAFIKGHFTKRTPMFNM